ncbi:hypothetical protein OSTOST_23622 [Ostertagia ostertagi]
MLPVEPQKLVVVVHGGPKTRDHYGYSPLNVFLTNRGYAVLQGKVLLQEVTRSWRVPNKIAQLKSLQVNFRGSTGFGRRLTNAGDGEWGRKMHFDILDSVEFAVAKGITNRSQVAIMGNEAGRQSLTARSPLFFADRVKKPLMILQGANDPRVKQRESDQFVAALEKHHIPVTYVLYPDEGHGLRKANNRLAQYGFIEQFLHMCLGGPFEPFQQGQYNSSAIVSEQWFYR